MPAFHKAHPAERFVPLCGCRCMADRQDAGGPRSGMLPIDEVPGFRRAPSMTRLVLLSPNLLRAGENSGI
jgi:hypothetical protein